MSAVANASVVQFQASAEAKFRAQYGDMPATKTEYAAWSAHYEQVVAIPVREYTLQLTQKENNIRSLFSRNQ